MEVDVPTREASLQAIAKVNLVSEGSPAFHAVMLFYNSLCIIIWVSGLQLLTIRLKYPTHWFFKKRFGAGSQN